LEMRGMDVHSFFRKACTVTNEWQYTASYAANGVRACLSAKTVAGRPLKVHLRSLDEILRPQEQAAQVYENLLKWIDAADLASQKPGCAPPPFRNEDGSHIFPQDDEGNDAKWWLTDLQLRIGEENVKRQQLCMDEALEPPEEEGPMPDPPAEDETEEDWTEDEAGDTCDNGTSSDDNEVVGHVAPSLPDYCGGVPATVPGELRPMWARPPRQQGGSSASVVELAASAGCAAMDALGSSPTGQNATMSSPQPAVPLALPHWEHGLDGQPLLTEHGLQAALLRHGLQRSPSETFGHNNCLVDSLLLSMQHAGYARHDITFEERRAAAAAARWHLVQEHGLPAAGDPYLAHDMHLAPIFDFLRAHCPLLWVDAACMADVELTATVFDRFNGRLVRDHRGQLDGLVPTEPVCVPPLRGGTGYDRTAHVQVQLYTYTHRDGSGWHYEWIRQADAPPMLEPSAATGCVQQAMRGEDLAVPSDDDCELEQ